MHPRFGGAFVSSHGFGRTKNSVIVPVAALRRVAVAVVDVVHVVTVRDRHVPAARTVFMVVTGVLLMPADLALVHVILVLTVQMTVVHVVDMTVVRDRHVSTALAVRMFVSGMLLVLHRCRHATHLQDQVADHRGQLVRNLLPFSISR